MRTAPRSYNTADSTRNRRSLLPRHPHEALQRQNRAQIQRLTHPPRHPLDVYNYRLGNRSALEWVIDQYRVTTDPRSGITNDPNREDDPQYVLRLIGQVITVSLETNRIVANLPTLGLPETLKTEPQTETTL